MNTATKKVRVKSRVRFTVFIIISMLLVFTGINVILGNNSVEGLAQQEYVQIQVQPGDTIWEMAKTYMPNNQDPRKSVDTICTTNDISADQLHPGQVLNIPVEL
ncbi:MAG: LysM peptidoglycan-binding domain-containing protein [Anaerovoracaceae bacterium]